MKRILCYFLGHDRGDVRARYIRGDVIRPPDFELERARAEGAETVMLRVRVTCLRCGKIVDA